MENDEVKHLKCSFSDLRFCVINKAKYNEQYFIGRKMLENVLCEFDNLDPLIMKDIFVMLNDIGIPGYQDAIIYLSEMLTYCVLKDGSTRVHKSLYPVIADKRKIASSTVESSIRKTLVIAFEANHCALKFNKIFDAHLTGFMGSGWFINTFTNFYRMFFKEQNLLYSDWKIKNNLN